MKQRIATLRQQRGQALTEFLVLAFALMPLFLLMPMIARYQDIVSATQQASRYVAFAATTRNDTVTAGWTPEGELANEVRRRFFGNSDAPIKTKDGAKDEESYRSAFWRGPTGDPLIASFGDVNVSFGGNNGTQHAQAFTSINDRASFSGVDGILGLSTRGIYRANVSVKLAKLPANLKFYEPFDKIDLSITRHASVLLDPWTANSPSQVEQRIGGNAGLFPAGQVGDAVSVLGNVGVTVIEGTHLPAPLLGQLDFWRDVVPDDRLNGEQP